MPKRARCVDSGQSLTGGQIRAWAFKTYKNLGKLPDRTEDGQSNLAPSRTSELVRQ
jgi:hypothetical protein